MFSAGLALAAAVTVALGAGLVRPTLHLLTDGGLVRENYRKQAIPTGAGLVIPLAVTPAALFLFAQSPPLPSLGAELILLNGTALMGLFDDGIGGGAARGIGGHFKSLWRGELTTGAVKALYGLSLALLAACLTLPPSAGMPERLVCAAVIALSANAINLFDLRPGRALKVFYLTYGAVALLAQNVGATTFLVALTALTLAPADFRGRAMMGDTGANVLGSTLGFFVVSQFGTSGRGIFLFLLVVLHVCAERFSLSRLIDRVPFLRWLDCLGR